MKFEIENQKASELGVFLKKIREKMGFSSNYVQIMTGINKADLSRMENGKKKKINPFYLKKLSEIYNLNQIELFIRAGYIDINTNIINNKTSNSSSKYLIEVDESEISKLIKENKNNNLYLVRLEKDNLNVIKISKIFEK